MFGYFGTWAIVGRRPTRLESTPSYCLVRRCPECKGNIVRARVFRIAGPWRFPRMDLERWLEGCLKLSTASVPRSWGLCWDCWFTAMGSTAHIGLVRVANNQLETGGFEYQQLHSLTQVVDLVLFAQPCKILSSAKFLRKY